MTVERASKVAFSSFDDKMYLMPCKIHAHPYGSVLIAQNLKNDRCSFCSSSAIM